MAEFTQALVARMLGDAGLAAALGSKVHWSIVPAGTELPYIRLQVISDPEAGDIKGRQTAHDARVQIDCFAKTYGAARTLAGLVKAALRGPALVDGVQFGRALFDGPIDGGEEGNAFVHRARMDAAIWHQVKA